MTVLPPPQYDVPPPMPVIEHVLTSDAINRICHERHAMDMAGRPASPAYRFSGCAHLSVTSNGKSCEVWRIDDGTVRRHEYGHCNGWPADHPDAAEMVRRRAADLAADRATLARVAAADRAAHHREIEKDAAANAAADRAAAIAPSSPPPLPAMRYFPPPTATPPHITVLKVRPVIAPEPPAPRHDVDPIAEAIRRTAPPSVRVPTVPLSPPGSAPVLAPWTIRDADVDRAPRAQQQPEGRSALDAIGDALVSGMTRR